MRRSSVRFRQAAPPEAWFRTALALVWQSLGRRGGCGGQSTPSADEHARFFRLIEEFTPAHMRLLKFLDDPRAVFDAAGIAKPDITAGARSHLLEAGMPEFRDQRPWYELLMGDLTRASLVTEQLGGMQTGPSFWESATSDLGKRFLVFISEG